MSASRSKTAPGPTPTRSRAIEGAILALAMMGAALSLELALLHARAHAGGASSFCAISERVNCDTVALSPWSVAFGVPLAAWGALAYLAIAGLAAAALGRDRPHPGWPAGLLSVGTGLLAVTAVVLALVSEIVIGAFCILCAASWLVSFALAMLSWRLARRAGGVGPALRADVRALRARPGPSAGAAATLLLAAVALVVAYAGSGRAAPPRAQAPDAGTTPATPPSIPSTPGAQPGSIVVYEFSDYACPFCARVHVTDKSLKARRPDVRIVRRHFPLDDACNPKLTRPFHVGACELARAGICAEAQGRFEAMDDALFANQAEKAPVEELAKRVGLDLDRFRACVASANTAARLSSDIQEGIQAGIRGTPSYVFQGKVFPGDLAQLLGEPSAVAR
jgi:protein-disulfide isomerase